MLRKAIKYSSLSLLSLMIISDTFYDKVDRNIARPIRNFKIVLNDHESWVVKEDIYNFLSELAKGTGKMFVYEHQKDY